MEDPSSFFIQPGYQAAFGQGTQAVMRGMSDQIGSGNMAIGLQQFGQGYGWNMLMEYEKFLAMLAGAGIGSNQGPGLAAGAAADTSMANSMFNLGGILSKWGPMIFGGSSGASAGTPGSMGGIPGGMGNELPNVVGPR